MYITENVIWPFVGFVCEGGSESECYAWLCDNGEH